MSTSEAASARWGRIVSTLYHWESLGVRELPNGTKLIGHVPGVAPEAHLHCIYPPLSMQSIAAMEAQLKASLPEGLRSLYSLTNGLNVFSDSLSVWGIRESYVRTGDAIWQPYDLVHGNLLGQRPRDAKPSVILIGSYNWDGSLLYFDVAASRKGVISRCSRDSVAVLNQWPDFWTMLEKEVDRLALLYGEDGLESNPDAPTVPPH